MTLLNYKETPDAGHIFTDGAIYDGRTAKVLGFASKVFPLPRYNAAIASCGGAWINLVLAEAISNARFKSFDEMAVNFTQHVKDFQRAAVDRVPPWGAFQSLLVGWSESADAPRAFVIRGDRGCHSERVTTFQMPVVDKSFKFDAADPVASGIRLVSKQRHATFYPLDRGSDAPLERVSGVGGFIQHSRLSRDGLMIKRVHDWPEDELGKVLTPLPEVGAETVWKPEPMDWAAFHALRSPAATGA